MPAAARVSMASGRRLAPVRAPPGRGDRSGHAPRPRRPVGVRHRGQPARPRAPPRPGDPLRTAASTKSGYCSGVTCRNGSSISGSQPVVGVAVVAFGQVAKGERGDGRGVDTAEAGLPHRLGERLDLGAGRTDPGQVGGVDHVLGLVADRPPELANLLDVGPGPPRGAAASARRATGSTGRCPAAAGNPPSRAASATRCRQASAAAVGPTARWSAPR